VLGVFEEPAESGLRPLTEDALAEAWRVYQMTHDVPAALERGKPPMSSS